METKTKTIGDITMHYREGTSDLSAIDEVIGRRSYERKYFQILPGETWVDLGGNIGAFTVLASHIGASVNWLKFTPNIFQRFTRSIRKSQSGKYLHRGA